MKKSRWITVIIITAILILSYFILTKKNTLWRVCIHLCCLYWLFILWNYYCTILQDLCCISKREFSISLQESCYICNDYWGIEYQRLFLLSAWRNCDRNASFFQAKSKIMDKKKE